MKEFTETEIRFRYSDEGSAVYIIGKIISPFIYSHTTRGNQHFFEGTVLMMRKSGKTDIVNVLTQYSLAQNFNIGDSVIIKGTIRSCDYYGWDCKRHLKVYVLAKNIVLCNNVAEDVNEFYIRGTICKEPLYRETISKTITDFILRVYNGHRIAYVPCIAWNENAEKIAFKTIGDFVAFSGRWQSREFFKSDKKVTVYEVSVNYLI